MHDPAELAHAARVLVSNAVLYGSAAVRARARAARSPRRSAAHGSQRRLGRRDGRVAFVVGSPRSGTTFTGRALGSQPGFADLGEVKPLKAAIPGLAGGDEAEAALEIRRVVERVRTLSFTGHLRSVEQTPETSFVLGAALRAYPEAIAVHALRDGRDVVCSLLERGWLNGRRDGRDDIGAAYGGHARFWVERDRRDEFERASEATRAAWAWRRYTLAARAVPERTVEIRYEALVTDPDGTAEQLASALGIDPASLADAFAAAHDRSLGRWRRELTDDQHADVEREAGPLLRELGYEAG